VLIIKQEPFLNIDDECWYQYVHYYLDNVFLYRVLRMI
jgi:hypothetical protein